MTRSRFIVRAALAILLLAGLLTGRVAPALISVHAAPHQAAPLDVIINEVAWGGTAASAFDGWIELYNPGSSAINLSGWTLNSSDSAPSINLTGSISANGYYLLERTNDNTISDIPADQFYTGDLGNSGETLTLRDASSTIIDTANSDGGGWDAGSDSPNYYSMERVGIVPDGPTAWASNNGVTRNGLDAGIPSGCTPNVDCTTNPQPINGTPGQPNSAAYASLQVVINEIAWAGTLASSDDEWIELYNPGGASINLTGWRLVADSGHVDIALNGNISAGGYFLLERAHDNTINDVAANQIYFGALSDAGETLRLRAPDGTIVDTANSDGGAWPAGDATTTDSMERMGVVSDTSQNWVTNVNASSWSKHDAANNLVHGTPGGHNWGFDVTQTPTPLPTSTPLPTFTPTPSASLSLLINEVAWMGTLASSSDEWIELYNPGSKSVNLSGWHLNATDGNPAITLSGTIAAGGYFVIAASGSVFNDLTPQMTFSGTLSNEGEVLRLIDPTGKIVDTANSDSGAWPAGIASPTYASMERRGAVTDGPTAWSTYDNPSPTNVVHDRNGNAVRGTPGRSNWGLTVTLTPSPTATETHVPTRTPTRASPINARVVINEFLPRAGFDWNKDGVIDVYDEFIEVKNLGPVDVDLKNWKLDDEPKVGSSPFTLPSQKLKPGERAIFYGSTTNILLDDSGDIVRLINPFGTVVDARGYGPVKEPDQTHCRIPDGDGYWRFPCFPTPGTENSLTGTLPIAVPSSGSSGTVQPACLLPDTVPNPFVRAECYAPGADIWSRSYWDDQAGDAWFPVIDMYTRWHTFVK